MKLDKENKVLVVIPARSGSKRIPQKNIRDFVGKPLIARAIEQSLESGIGDRVIVDTDSEEIANVAREYGAEVPYIRPAHLATDESPIVDSLIYLLEQLKEKENYEPTHVMILQTTSPLREVEDIYNCWEMMKDGNATTVLTVCPTHPRLYYMDGNRITLVNGSEDQSSNIQEWRPAYILNGCFVYIVKTNALLEERKVVTKHTEAVVCPKWRSVDLDEIEDWVIAEKLFTHKEDIKKRIEKFS